MKSGKKKSHRGGFRAGSGRKKIDWNPICHAFENEVVSVRALAERFRVSEGGIRKRAILLGWVARNDNVMTETQPPQKYYAPVPKQYHFPRDKKFGSALIVSYLEIDGQACITPGDLSRNTGIPYATLVRWRGDAFGPRARAA